METLKKIIYPYAVFALIIGLCVWVSVSKTQTESTQNDKIDLLINDDRTLEEVTAALEKDSKEFDQRMDAMNQDIQSINESLVSIDDMLDEILCNVCKRQGRREALESSNK